jgi:hypothetical protein
MCQLEYINKRDTSTTYNSFQSVPAELGSVGKLQKRLSLEVARRTFANDFFVARVAGLAVDACKMCTETRSLSSKHAQKSPKQLGKKLNSLAALHCLPSPPSPPSDERFQESFITLACLPTCSHASFATHRNRSLLTDCTQMTRHVTNTL